MNNHVFISFPAVQIWSFICSLALELCILFKPSSRKNPSLRVKPHPIPDFFNWIKRVQQLQFSETQIWHPYCYIRIFSRGLLLLVVYKLVFLPSSCFPLFHCRAFFHGFPFPYALKVFSRFYCKLRNCLLFYASSNCLTNAGLVCALRFPRLLSSLQVL